MSLDNARERFDGCILPTLRRALIEGKSQSFPLQQQIQKSGRLTNFLNSSLRVSKELTPELDKTLGRACARLRIERDLVDLYVFPGAEINAFCFLNDFPIVVGISSAIANKFDSDELAFVIGHELGHVFFRNVSNFEPDPQCLEDQMISRTIELSVDRVGLVATGSVEAAFRAILKSLSGLDAQNLRFDFSMFMNETRDLSSGVVTQQMLYASHPPLPLRFRALVGFSMTDLYQSLTSSDPVSGTAVSSINDLIETSLANFDDVARCEINRLVDDLLLWIVTFLIINKKQIRLSDLREVLHRELDKTSIERAVRLIDSSESSVRDALINEKIQDSLVLALRAAPRMTHQVLFELGKLFPDLRVFIPQRTTF